MKIITLTGPSCSGKTTLLNTLVEKYGYASIVSHTTRPPRIKEVDGKDYYFVTDEQFTDSLAKGEFMEHVNFSDYYYGVSVKELASVTQGGKIAVLIVEPNGLKQMQKFADENPDIDMYNVYIGGRLPVLMTRYIQRCAGEDLSNLDTAQRHGKRLASLTKECISWEPGISSDVMYDYVIGEFGSANQWDVISNIINLECN